MIDILILCYIFIQMFSEVLFEVKTNVKNKLLKFIISKLYCFKCLTFWTTLILTGDVFFSSKMSLIVIVYESIKPTLLIVWDKIKNKIER